VNQVFRVFREGRTSAVDAGVLPFLRGCGQMLFQPSVRTGCVFVALILWQSPAALAACLAGALGSTLCARALEYPGKAYFDGEGGFNGGLLGLAFALFYQPGGVVLAVVFAGGVLTGVVRVALRRLLPVPPFTAPFILVAGLGFAASGILGLVPAQPLSIQGPTIYAPLNNASQVLFLLDPRVGALVFVAVLLHSRTSAAWVGAASAIAWLSAELFRLPPGPCAAGLLGYNALVLAAALEHRSTNIPLAAGGIVLSVVLTDLLLEAGITPLSIPFVVSAWLVIGVQTTLARKR